MTDSIAILRNFEGSCKLAFAHPEIVKAVQIQLAKAGLLGSADGIPGRLTLAAFAKFKKLEFLEQPEILGKTTAEALINASETHSPPQDTSTPDVPGRLIRVPGFGQVRASDPVYFGSHFSWGELTKGLDRIPASEAIAQNLVRLAEYLDKARKEILDQRPITITSGYRPPAINRAVGGVSNSRHLFGDAADIVVMGLTPHEVFRRLDRWHGDKGGLGDSHAFTHLDLRGYRARWNYGNA